MLFKRLNLLPVLFAMCLLILACSKTDDTYRDQVPNSKVDLSTYDYIVGKGAAFDTLVYIINKADLSETLKASTVTFFAPTDQSISIAMSNLNTNRAASKLPPLGIDDIDAFTWRLLLSRYIIPGELNSVDFSLADGLDVITLSKRRLHVNAISTTTQGSVGSGSYLLRYSDMNGSRFVRDWVFSFATLSDLKTNNGYLNILEPNHIFGFKSFIYYANNLQNPYSDRYYVSGGNILFPTAVRRYWVELYKEVIAIDQHTVEVDGADLKTSGMYLRLTVNPVDYTVTVLAAPKSIDRDITNNGKPCYYDPVNKEFVLNYRYGNAAGDRNVTELIKLRNY